MNKEKLKFWLMVGIVAVLAVFVFKYSAKFIPVPALQSAAAMV